MTKHTEIEINCPECLKPIEISSRIKWVIRDERADERKQILEEILEDIGYGIKAWKLIKKKEPLYDTAEHMLSVLYGWQKVYEQKIKDVGK